MDIILDVPERSPYLSSVMIPYYLMPFCVPLLQPSASEADHHCVRRPFFDGADGSLTVFYAIVQPEGNFYVTLENFAELGMSVAQWEEACLQNWLRDHADLEWQSLPIDHGPPIMAARAESDTMAAILLSHGHLKGMHKHFGEQTLYVGIPDRFTVLVHTNPLLFAGVVEGMYADAVKHGSQFSRDLYCSMNGVIVATCAPTLSMAAGVDVIVQMIGHIFLMVAAADGNMDRKEMQQFVQTLMNFVTHTRGMVHQASLRLLETDLAPVKALVGTITVQGGFSFLADAANRLRTGFGVEEYQIIAQALNLLANNIANASGSLLSRSKVSEEEAMALHLIATALEQ